MPTGKQVQLSIRRFTDYAGDLLRSDMNTFDDALTVFTEFCETDTVFGSFHAQLQSVSGVDFDQWYEDRRATGGSFAGSCQLTFPTDQEQRMALMYELLRRIHDGRIPFQDFVLRFFALSKHAKITDYVRALNEAISRPLIRELRYRLEEMSAGLPSDGTSQVPPASIQIIHKATNVIQQSAVGSNIEQNAEIEVNPEIDRLFDQLVEAVRGVETDPAVLEEQLEIVETARTEAKQPSPKRGVIRTLLTGLTAGGAVSEITSLILDLIAGG